MPPSRYALRTPPGVKTRRPGEQRGVQRWVDGDTDPVSAYVDEQTRIETGDLVWMHGHLCLPAGELALRTAGTATWTQQQAVVARGFLGVALERSPIGQAGVVRVATAGDFVFPCRATRAQVGARVAVEPSLDGTCLADHRVILTPDPARAVGRVARIARNQATQLTVRIFSRVFVPPCWEIKKR